MTLIQCDPQARALDRDLCSRLGEFGITRLADTTGLDRLDVPTHSCVKPGTTDTIWVYSGKGMTPEQSRISAVMECLERTAALWDTGRVVLASREEIAQRGAAWGPERFTEMSCDLGAGEPLAWVEAECLRGDGSVWVPADLVFTGMRPRLAAAPAFEVTTSNGLGAGLSREDAVSQALGEVIERDAVSLAELRASHYGMAFLAAVAREIGSDHEWLRDIFQDDTDFAVTVEPDSLPPPAQALHRRFADAGVELQIKHIPNDLGVPVFGAAAIDMMSFNNVLAAAGYGVGLDPERALCSAILELAQSRATDRQGAREDCGRGEKARLDQIPTSHWLATPSKSVTSFASLRWPRAERASRSEELLGRLSSVGLDEAVVVDFKSSPGIYAVRVLVPGIETWHPTAGMSRVGPRAARCFSGG